MRKPGRSKKTEFIDLNLNKKIEEMEKELKRLKDIRMVQSAENESQLLKFEHSYFRGQIAGNANFIKWKNEKYGIDAGASIIWKHVMHDSIISVTNNRTDKFTMMTFEEKMQLREKTRSIIDELAKELK
jgi:hypothetical protein